MTFKAPNDYSSLHTLQAKVTNVAMPQLSSTATVLQLVATQQ
jgi:hypothetical protein